MCHSSLLADMLCMVVQAVQEEGMEAAHMLCMAAAPAAREEALALWAWLRTQWALGLLEAWAMASKAEARATGHTPFLKPIAKPTALRCRHHANVAQLPLNKPLPFAATVHGCG